MEEGSVIRGCLLERVPFTMGLGTLFASVTVLGKSWNRQVTFVILISGNTFVINVNCRCYALNPECALPFRLQQKVFLELC